MDKAKLLSSIGMAFGAGKVVSGEKLLDFIKAEKVSLVFIGSNMGPTQKKKITNKCNFYEIENYSDLLTVEEIAHACGKQTMVAVGIDDRNFIKLIKSHL